jgi:hypothetical protein
MELLEAPSISSVDRRVVFPSIKWLTKAKFEEYLKQPNQFEIYPNIDTIYIGKTIPNSLDEGVAYGYDYRLNKQINLEIIGTVSQNVDKEWQLNVSHGGRVYEIKKDFLVLCLNDCESFRWIDTQLDSIPKYSLRGAVDQ